MTEAGTHTGARPEQPPRLQIEKGGSAIGGPQGQLHCEGAGDCAQPGPSPRAEQSVLAGLVASARLHS